VAHDECVQLRTQPEQKEAILAVGVLGIRHEQGTFVIEDGGGLCEGNPALPPVGEILALVPLERSGLIPTAYL
jgi:hypothetical protein